MLVRITRLDPSVPLPRYETPGSVAFDLRARREVIVAPRALAKIPTGLVIATPPGFTLIVASRSSTPERKGLLTPHGIGIVDQDFCGPEDELQIQVYNFSDTPVTITASERIAQGMIVPVARAEWMEGPANDTNRGGFGSTGHT